MRWLICRSSKHAPDHSRIPAAASGVATSACWCEWKRRSICEARILHHPRFEGTHRAGVSGPFLTSRLLLDAIRFALNDRDTAVGLLPPDTRQVAARLATADAGADRVEAG